MTSPTPSRGTRTGLVVPPSSRATTAARGTLTASRGRRSRRARGRAPRGFGPGGGTAGGLVHRPEGLEDAVLGEPEGVVVDPHAARQGAAGPRAPAGQRARAGFERPAAPTQPRHRV